MRCYRIATIPGDGIGMEVIPAGIHVLEAATRRYDFRLDWQHFDWSSATYARTGRWMPPDGIHQLRECDAILLGAVGTPEVPDHVSLWGLLIPIRRQFDQYVNLRPCRLLPGLTTPLAGRACEDIDLVVIRENSEGEYSEIGGRLYQGTDREVVMQESVFTRQGVDRILRYAFEFARTRPKRHVTSASKSNGITYTMPFWDERFRAMAAQYEDISTDQYHVDILSAHLVAHPDWFDVVVGSNLFGDILSEVGAAIAGGLGIAPSANINPEKRYPSMFEPIHGSAPDIAGRGTANPIAAIWAGALMLRHIGEAEAALAVETAIERVMAPDGPRTPDLGGTARTSDVAKAVAEAVA